MLLERQESMWSVRRVFPLLRCPLSLKLLVSNALCLYEDNNFWETESSCSKVASVIEALDLARTIITLRGQDKTGMFYVKVNQVVMLTRTSLVLKIFDLLCRC